MGEGGGGPVLIYTLGGGFLSCPRERRGFWDSKHLKQSIEFGWNAKRGRA